MGVTQKEIAQRLNVSQAHVARALGGRSAVSEETRRRIEAVAREMGYDPDANREARALAGRRHSQRMKTYLVAVALTMPVGIVPRHFPFYSEFLEGVESEAAASGYDVCIMHKRYKEVPRLLRSCELDGAIVAGFTLDQIPLIRASGLAVVTYQAPCPGVSSIRPDDHSGMYQMTKHLLELGHRDIAFLGVVAYEDSEEVVALRVQGYRDALNEYGIPFRPEWVDTSLLTPDSSGKNYCAGCDYCAACNGWDVLKRKSGMMAGDKPPFTAVVCHNDTISMGLIEHARADGLEIPRDLSVTGFDNISEQYGSPISITSVGCSHFEMGRDAMRLLREAIEAAPESPNAEETAAIEQISPVFLTVGESTAAPAVERQQ